MKYLLFAACLFSAGLSYSQTWLDQARRQQNMTRIGIGAQLKDPTGLVFQLYRGGFCSNDNTYANYLTLEAFAGFENVLLPSHSTYKTGTWQGGGFQGGVNLLYPLYTLPAPAFSAQVHVGAGLQGGQRKYTEQSRSLTDATFGSNLMLRFSFTGRGVEFNERLWFVSYFIDAKYYSQFGEKFSFFRPSFGVVFRKVR